MQSDCFLSTAVDMILVRQWYSPKALLVALPSIAWTKTLFPGSWNATVKPGHEHTAASDALIEALRNARKRPFNLASHFPW